MLRHRLAALLLLVLVAVVGMVDTGVAAVVEEGSTGTHHHHPPLLDCGPALTTPSRNGDAAFRTNLSSALAALPSAAASAPHAFATVHVGRAFARGACYCANVSSSPAAASACNACLSAAARDVTGGCGATTARAGAWRDECFVSYADSDASSLRDDAFRGWFYAGPTTPAALAGGYCLLESAADCDRCFHDSARAVAALGWLQRIHGDEVLVVRYSCFLRVKISLLPQGPEYGGPGAAAFVIWMDIVVDSAAVMLALVFVRIVKIVRALP